MSKTQEAVKDIYRSVLHKNCGGEIVFIAKDKNDAMLACKKCKQIWEMSTPFIKKTSIASDMYIIEIPGTSS